jgi:D-alanyl-D-alanine carboxypeptidase
MLISNSMYFLHFPAPPSFLPKDKDGNVVDFSNAKKPAKPAAPVVVTAPSSSAEGAGKKLLEAALQRLDAEKNGSSIEQQKLQQAAEPKKKEEEEVLLKAQKEADEKAKAEAEEKAKKEAEEKAKLEAEEIAKNDAEAKAASLREEEKKVALSKPKSAGTLTKGGRLLYTKAILLRYTGKEFGKD